MTSLLDTIAPPRLGGRFRLLFAAAWSMNLGDGIALAAGPLLVASLTDHAFLVASAATVQWLPVLLFGLIAGAVTDRLDRRLIVVLLNLVRVGVLAVLSAAVVTDAVSIAWVLVSLFLLGTAEIFADNASQSLLPMVVERDDLAVGNARLMTAFIGANQLAGPPVGAALFAAGMAWPFAAQAMLVLMGAMLISRVALPDHGPAVQTERSRMRDDIRAGLGWVRRHAAVRTLVLTIFTFNITFGAAWSVLVLYVTQRLDLGSVGFGAVTTVGAIGGLAGTASYGWITRHATLAQLLRIGLVVETLTHLGLAVTTTAWVALPIFFVFGAHAFIWGTTSQTVRQRAVPMELQGRVGSVNSVATMGGLVLGSVVGGVLAQRWGVTAPFWFAFGGSALFVVLIWGQLAHVAHGDEQPLGRAARTTP
ncbi:MAG: Major facilitator superfamily 1 [Thermoleophilia bacterium]|nr:Major facilitator superfamily 1 [Thermoleophilia bacterium]